MLSRGRSLQVSQLNGPLEQTTTGQHHTEVSELVQQLDTERKRAEVYRKKFHSAAAAMRERERAFASTLQNMEARSNAALEGLECRMMDAHKKWTEAASAKKKEHDDVCALVLELQRECEGLIGAVNARDVSLAAHAERLVAAEDRLRSLCCGNTPPETVIADLRTNLTRAEESVATLQRDRTRIVSLSQRQLQEMARREKALTAEVVALRSEVAALQPLKTGLRGHVDGNGSVLDDSLENGVPDGRRCHVCPHLERNIDVLKQKVTEAHRQLRDEREEARKREDTLRQRLQASLRQAEGSSRSKEEEELRACLHTKQREFDEYKRVAEKFRADVAVKVADVDALRAELEAARMDAELANLAKETALMEREAACPARPSSPPPEKDGGPMDGLFARLADDNERLQRLYNAARVALIVERASRERLERLFSPVATDDWRGAMSKDSMCSSSFLPLAAASSFAQVDDVDATILYHDSPAAPPAKSPASGALLCVEVSTPSQVKVSGTFTPICAPLAFSPD